MSAVGTTRQASACIACSPQARGRVERLNRTLQDRLVKELTLHGIGTIEAANSYLRDHFIPAYNSEFTRPPADPASAFVPVGNVDLDQILCHAEERAVGEDNVVTLDTVALQIAKQPGRRTCTGLRVSVRRHLNGQHSVWHGTRCLGRYDARGQAVPLPQRRRPRNARAHLRYNRRSGRRPCLDIPRKRAPRVRRGPRLPVGPKD